MAMLCIVKPGTYQDSVKLMRICAAARAVPGVTDAACIMGTDRNKETLAASGLLLPAAASAGPDDLVLVVQAAAAEAAGQALARLEALLAERLPPAGGLGRPPAPRTLESALREAPGLNLALISVPGPYAAAEAARALRRGLHVHVFSDNVSLEDEIALKQLGRELGLLVMGPDCGTAIIGGVPLGFANAVARGPIGIAGPSGTGIQQATVLIDRMGSGISHAIGTGGRDLSDPVGGVTTLMALDALAEDPDTRVILLVGKRPGARTLGRVLDRVRASAKPVVACLLGSDPELVAAAGATPVQTLEEAATRAVAAAGLQRGPAGTAGFPCAPAEGWLARAEAAQKQPGQRCLRGLFTGGTLADEAMLVMGPALGPIWANVPLRREWQLADPWQSTGHTVVDLGDDAFTRGRPHPMIDPTVRSERLVREAADPEVAVLLCDVVTGYGAHPDPAGALAAAVEQARDRAGRHLTVVASVCGTAADPQAVDRQEAALRRAGVLVFPSNAGAARVAGAVARACAERGGA